MKLHEIQQKPKTQYTSVELMRWCEAVGLDAIIENPDTGLQTVEELSLQTWFPLAYPTRFGETLCIVSNSVARMRDHDLIGLCEDIEDGKAIMTSGMRFYLYLNVEVPIDVQNVIRLRNALANSGTIKIMSKALISSNNRDRAKALENIVGKADNIIDMHNDFVEAGLTQWADRIGQAS